MERLEGVSELVRESESVCVCGRAGFKEEGVARRAERRSPAEDWWGGRRWRMAVQPERGWALKVPRDLEKREKVR